MKKLFLPAFYIFLVIVFFWQFFFKGSLPIPADTIVGMYYPFRDIYKETNPNGIPFKNFLLTDPVRQQYTWKSLAIENIKKGNLPLWNPYNFSGTPHLANFQSAPFYPLNILFFVMPFEYAWSILIFLQPLIAGIFIYIYLNNLRIKKLASLLGAITFSFCGFSIAWLEWGTILNTALWLPLILLSIDKLFVQNMDLKRNKKNIFKWLFIFSLALSFSFFAGHLQIFFYLSLFTILYILSRLIICNNKLKNLLFLAIGLFIFLVITFIQWYPTLKFISLSARNIDVVGWRAEGWFVPWQNLIQFLIPDFFGNPATLNYYGIWNYAEFVGYVGIIPLILAFFALFFKKNRKILFFGTVFFLSLIFAFPTFIAKLPFKLEIPFISTSQPTRLLFITDFSLSILAALGLDYFIRSTESRKKILYIFGIFLFIFALLWLFIVFSKGEIIALDSLRVAKQNLILPTVLIIASFLTFLLIIFYPKENRFNKNVLTVLFSLLIFITIFDLFRFGWKFEPFSKKEYLFPKTSIISFLKEQEQPFRVMATDPSIFPPNFSIMYNLQTLDGYDPLYLRRYGELMAAVGRGKPDISSPFGFNRIITPQNVSSRITDLLGVKFVLSLNELDDSKLSKVYEDGKIIVYENTRAYLRAFFVVNTLIVNSRQEAIEQIFNINNPLEKTAIVENVSNKSLFKSNWDLGKIEFVSYEENKVVLKTSSTGDGFLVLTDSHYPTWKARIDGKETKIFLTDYNFRGIIVPKGEHKIEFINSLF